MLEITGTKLKFSRKEKDKLYYASSLGDWSVWEQFAATHNMDGITGMKSIAGNCLLQAAAGGHIDHCRFLYERFKVPITYRNKAQSETRTVLMSALLNGHSDILDWVKSVANEDEWTELITYPCYSAAILSGDRELATAIHGMGAKPPKKAKRSFNPAYCSLFTGDADFIKEILERHPEYKRADLYDSVFRNYRKSQGFFGKTVEITKEKAFIAIETLLSIGVGSPDDPDAINNNPIYLIGRGNNLGGVDLEVLLKFLSHGVTYNINHLEKIYGKNPGENYTKFIKGWGAYKNAQTVYADIQTIRDQFNALGFGSMKLMEPYINALENEYVAEITENNGVYRTSNLDHLTL